MIKQLAFRPVLSCGLSTWLRRNTLLLALPMLASSCDPGQLEPDANAVAINVLGLTSDATKLVVTTTLDGKATTNTEPMEVTTKLTRFGLRLAKELTGTLTVGIDAYDAELCKVGSGSVSTPVGSPYRFEITASMKTVSPRQCPPPPPAKTCAPNLFCWSNPLPQGNTFQSLWAVAANDVWAVGDAGTIHHYDGSKWTAVASGTTENLLSVWAASATEVIAVGTNGKAFRYDGTQWTAETTGSTKRLSAIWGSGINAFAVGEGGTILRRSGGTWNPLTSGVTTNLTSVWGRAASEVYAVGDAGVIRKFDGNNWTAMTSPTTANLASIWGDATTAVAVGANGTIIGLTGTAWSMQTSGTTEQLGGVFSPMAGQYLAVGTNGLILRGSGGTWTPQGASTNLALTSARGSSPSDIWVSGAGGQLTHFDGTKWSSSRRGLETNFRNIAALSAKNIWAIGDGGLIAHYDGTTWTQVDSGTTANLSGIWAVSPNEIYAVGDNNTFLRYLGQNWTVGSYPTVSVHARGVWASGSANIWSVATSSTANQSWLFQYNGVTWSGFTMSDPNAPTTNRVTNVNSMWGTTQGTNNLLYFCGKSYVAFSNVAGTTANTSFGFPSSGLELRSIFGTSSTDVWAVGDGGLVYQNNGGGWQIVSTGLPAVNLGGLWRQSGTSDLWIVGDQGTLWKMEGTMWSAKETNTRNRLLSISGLSQSDVWVSGMSGTILHTLPQ